MKIEVHSALGWDFAHAPIFLHLNEYDLVYPPPPPTPLPPSQHSSIFRQSNCSCNSIPAPWETSICGAPSHTARYHHLWTCRPAAHVAVQIGCELWERDCVPRWLTIRGNDRCLKKRGEYYCWGIRWWRGRRGSQISWCGCSRWGTLWRHSRFSTPHSSHLLSQYTKELISACKTLHKHNNKDLSGLQ